MFRVVSRLAFFNILILVGFSFAKNLESFQSSESLAELERNNSKETADLSEIEQTNKILFGSTEFQKSDSDDDDESSEKKQKLPIDSSLMKRSEKSFKKTFNPQTSIILPFCGFFYCLLNFLKIPSKRMG